MTLTRVELKEILSNKNYPTFIGIVTRTPVKMNQYDNYWLTVDGKRKKNPNPTPNLFFENGIYKISKQYQIVTGFDYEKSVNRRLEKEGKDNDFKTQENWFDVISKSLVTDKKTNSKFYLRYQRQEKSTISKVYEYKGDPIEKTLFESFLVEKKNSYTKQGLDSPLQFQVVDLNNILSISMDGEVYELTGEV